MTGEAVLQELRAIEVRRERAKAMAGVLMLEAHENVSSKREDWCDPDGRNGTVLHKQVKVNGQTCFLVQMLDAFGGLCHFALSEQSSTDAEAHALQNWINDRNEKKVRT